MTAHLLYLPVTGKHHESKRVFKLLVIRSADRDLCIIRKYNALMTVSTYSMEINGKAVMEYRSRAPDNCVNFRRNTDIVYAVSEASGTLLSEPEEDTFPSAVYG